MYVVHAFWIATGSACLWGEDSAPPAGRGHPVSGRHPYAMASSTLGDLVGLPADPAREVTLLLPTVGKEPVPSPELVRPVSAGVPRQRAEPVLSAWRIPMLVVPTGHRLGELRRAAVQHEDLIAGTTLRWLADVEEFADDLVGRGRVLPCVRDEEHGPAARWRPIFGGPDAATLRSVAAAMPPVCRAETLGGSTWRSTRDVVVGALNGLVDRLTRERLRRTDLAHNGAAPGLEERWLRALTARDPRIDVQGDDDVDGVAAALDAWHAALHAGAGPVRACFRLTEPGEGDGDRWRVEFLLQATEDPSLLIPAEKVWIINDRVLATSYGLVDDPQEALLADLGRASRLYPEIERELRTRHPTALELDTDGAQRFLRTAAPLLLDAGFGVLLPTWWSTRRARIGLRLRASPTTRDPAAAAGGLGMDSLVDFRWELALGDEMLTEQELAELARHKAPLVRLRGQWVEVDQDELAKAADFVTARGGGEATARDVLGAAVHPDRAADGLPVIGVHADGWLGALLDGELAATMEPAPPPATFAGELRPYQERGLSWLAFLSRLGLGACLADDMGLGKTVQLLGLLSTDADRPPQSGPTLIVCPMSVVGNWQREAARFTPRLRVYVHHGADRLTGGELRDAVAQADLVLTTYSLAGRDINHLASVPWGRVVLDEAQNIKNSQTRQTQAIRRLRAAHRIALTGTPVENRLSELWSIMDFLNPGLLGPATAFRERFAIPIERRGDEDAAARLRRVTQPFILRRVKTDKTIINDLPDKLEMTVLCNLTAEQASLYQAVVDDMLNKIDDAEGIERRGLVLATMAKLKQVCNHPAHLLRDGSRLPGRSGKLARLEEIAEEVVADGDKALVFTQFAEFGAMLQPYLTGRLQVPVLYLHGGTAKKQRDALVARFQDDPEPAIFVLSLKAGGTGLNLTAANHVIHFDRWWNPAVEDQATDRAFRIGQRRDVQVRKFVSVGTVEEHIDTMIEQKKVLAAMVVGSGESWLTELSTDDLRALVALDPDAVSE